MINRSIAIKGRVPLAAALVIVWMLILWFGMAAGQPIAVILLGLNTLGGIIFFVILLYKIGFRS